MCFSLNYLCYNKISEVEFMYQISYQFPNNKDFNELFNSVGWGNRDNNKIDQHRKASSFSVCVFIDNKIIGMARVVGDGAYFTIYDVVVKKEYQKQGVGTILMNEIMKWYKSIEDDDTCLYLGATFGKEQFYEKFGFKTRPYDNIGAGMKYDAN